MNRFIDDLLGLTPTQFLIVVLTPAAYLATSAAIFLVKRLNTTRRDETLKKTLKGNPMSEYLVVKDMLALLKCSKATLYREVQAGRLPRPFKLSLGKSAWHKDEVKGLIEQRRMAAKGQ